MILMRLPYCQFWPVSIFLIPVWTGCQRARQNHYVDFAKTSSDTCSCSIFSQLGSTIVRPDTNAKVWQSARTRYGTDSFTDNFKNFWCLKGTNQPVIWFPNRQSFTQPLKYIIFLCMSLLLKKTVNKSDCTNNRILSLSSQAEAKHTHKPQWPIFPVLPQPRHTISRTCTVGKTSLCEVIIFSFPEIF